MPAAGVSLVLKRMLASVLFANFLFLSTLLRDRGKAVPDQEDISSFASTFTGDSENPLEFVNNQWRFKSERKLPHSRNLLSKTSALRDFELLNCDDLPQLSSTTNYINSGWTKAVYRGETAAGRNVALKIVNLDGRHMTDCLANQRTVSDCYADAGQKLLKEIVLLNSLQHTNIIQMLGYCIPARPLDVPGTESAERLAVITELGEPLELIKILQMDWEERLRILYDLSHLLSYLSSSPLGSIGVRDFRRQQFVTVSGVLKAVDFDDFVLQEPHCSSDAECHIPKSNLHVKVDCKNGFCTGFNELQNLHSAAKVFFKDNLQYGAPVYLDSKVRVFLERLNNANLTAVDLKNQMVDFARQLGSKSYTGQNGIKSQISESGFTSEVQRDLPGVGDYQCVGSRNMVGCTLGVTTVQEAEDICLSHSACKAFVWTPEKTWTGRFIVHFKNHVASPSFNSLTFLYVRKNV